MPLPDYANPPVSETVIGVQFDRLPRLKNGHLGAFWAALSKAEWPTIGDAPPLPSQFEQFGESRWSKAVQLHITQDPAYRIQIKNADANRMIQLQNSRLHYNWMKGEGGGTYPHYDAVRREFVGILDTFRGFVAAYDLGDFRPNQWEVTYVNQIPSGTVWNTPADWAFFRPLAGLPTIAGLIEGESFGGEWHFVIPGQRGRLHINWHHGKASRKEGELADVDSIRLNLTARGPIQSGEGNGNAALAGLDLGHETIVQTFEQLMSESANRYWGLKHASDH